MKLTHYFLPLLPLIYSPEIMAQTPPLPPLTPPPEIEILPPLEELLPEITPPDLPPSIPEIPGEITVTKFNVQGSTVFSQEELNGILTGFINRAITFTDLLQAQDIITDYYISKGYISSGAFIPPQTIKDGVVTIQIVEGGVEEINITGLNRLNSNYIRSRIAKGAKTPLNQNTLLTALQLLQLNPLIQRLNVELATGSRPGLNVINVVAKEADAFSTTLDINNQKSTSVGTFRGGLELNHNNLTGQGDQLRISYSHSEGSDSLDSFRYTLPINPSNGTISFTHARSSSEVIEKPFDQLNLSSRYLGYEITYRQPIIETPGRELIFGITGTKKESRGKLDGEPFSFTGLGNDRGETEVAALRLFTEYLDRDSVQVLAFKSEISFGLDILNATTNNSQNVPDGQFLTWRTQGQYLRKITEDTVFVLRGDLQLANDILLPLEQFSSGGQFSVRGYRQDAFLTDNGFFASAEIRTPIAKIPQWNTVLQIAPFFDFGTIWNNAKSTSNLEKNTISSMGLGLLLSVGNNFQARLDWGIPLVDVSNNGNSLQENGLYFQLRYSPF